MTNKILFVFAIITTMVLHAYALSITKIPKTTVVVKPQKKVSPIINLQRVAIKTPEPIVEPVVEKVLPEPPKPVVEEIVIPLPKKIKKKAIKKLVKKKKIVKKKKLVKKKKVIKKKKIVKKKTKPKKVAKVTAKSKLSSPKRKAIKNSYLSKVRRIIEQHKKYPRTAKRMKQQGTAYVKFTISSNGQIRHISLAKKCPFKKLNFAAVDILKQIRKFAPIPKELNETYLSLTVPITYKILN